MGCSQLGAIKNKVAVSILGQAFWCSFLLGKSLGVEWLGHKADAYVIGF